MGTKSRTLTEIFQLQTKRPPKECQEVVKDSITHMEGINNTGHENMGKGSIIQFLHGDLRLTTITQ